MADLSLFDSSTYAQQPSAPPPAASAVDPLDLFHSANYQAAAPPAPVAVVPSDLFHSNNYLTAARPTPGGQPYQSVQPRVLEPDEPGYQPGRWTNLSREDWAKFQGGPVVATPAASDPGPMLPPPIEVSGAKPEGATVTLPVPPRSGMLANAGAGALEASAGTMNALSDPFGNLIGKPLAVLGVTAHDALAPVFGYQKFSPADRAMLLDDQTPQIGDQMVSMGAHALNVPQPQDVQPGNMAESLMRSGVRGGLGMAGMGLAGGPLSLGGSAIQAAGGAAAGVAGDLAQRVVPPEYAPIAGMAANTLAYTPAAMAHTGYNAGLRYLAPARGPVNQLYDGSTPLMGSDGSPVMASPVQADLAGQQIQAAATNPTAVRNASAAPPAPPVQGAAPTTFQMTRDPGLGQLERGVARASPDAAAAFRAQSDAQNDARVAAVRQVGATGDVAAVPVALQQQAASADAAAGARVQAAQGQATQALGAVGGDMPPGSEGVLGQALRGSLEGPYKTARARESGLWNAIDPDGLLRVDMRPIRNGAQAITGEMSPNAAPLAGNEAGVFQTAAGLPDVQSFRDLGALRSRLTDALRQERSNPQGDPQSVRRLSMLLDHVHDAMEGSVNGQAAQDAAAVRAGTMAPEDSIIGRLQAEANAFQQARRAQAGGVSGASYPANPGGGSAGVRGIAGAEVSARGRAGPLAGGPGLQSPAPLTPNFDDAARARYAAARAATAQNRATFDKAPGVGEALRSGPTSGSYNAPAATIPNILIKTGPQGAGVAQAFINAGGSPAALAEAAAFQLRQAAMRDGVLDPGKYETWANQRSSFLSAVPDVASKFRTAAQAQRTVDDAVAARAQVNKSIQDSVIGQFMGNADPVTQVAKILRSPTAVADMRSLSQAVQGNPQAAAGLRRAIGEHILRDLKGDATGPTGGESYLKGAQLQAFLRKTEPALREVLTPEELGTLEGVSRSLEQSNLSVGGTKLPGGSDTVQNAAHGSQTLMGRLAHELASTAIGRTLGAAVGFGIGGIGGSMVGNELGAALNRATQAAREAGMSNVSNLVAEAMLNPQLARVLLSRVTPGTAPSLIRDLTTELRRISMVSGMQVQSDPRRRVRDNSLLSVSPTTSNNLMPPSALFPTPPRNQLMH